MPIQIVDELRRAAEEREELAAAYERKAQALRQEAHGFEYEARRVERIMGHPGASTERPA